MLNGMKQRINEQELRMSRNATAITFFIAYRFNVSDGNFAFLSYGSKMSPVSGSFLG